MKKKIALVLISFVVIILPGILLSQTFNEIVQQPSYVIDISTGANKLKSKLEEEVSKIITAGHLMPFRVQYGEGGERIMFNEPWIMMLILAKAYPYVSGSLKSQIVTYIQTEIQSYAPWGNSGLPASGYYRQGEPAGAPEMNQPGSYKRRGTMLYALWLYGYNTGDWGDIQSNWSTIQSAYSSIQSSQHTYELISGAIGMSRMAQAFGDDTLRQQYENDAVSYMNEGLTFETYRSNAHQDYSGSSNWSRGDNGAPYPLYYLTPEVARYINTDNTLKNAVINYVEQAPTDQNNNGVPIPEGSFWSWPLWWMAQAPVGDWGLRHPPQINFGCLAAVQ